MRPDARAWFQHRTTSATALAEIDLDALLRAKRRGGHRVSVVLPARNEEATVGRLVADLREHWMRRRARWSTSCSSSTPTPPTPPPPSPGPPAPTSSPPPTCCPRTAPAPARARRCGSRWPRPPATSSSSSTPTCIGDVAHYVPGLLGPLLDRPAGRSYVKGCYTRPLEIDGARPARRRRPGHRADRPAAAQRAVAGAGRLRPAARRRVRRPPVGAGAGAVRVGLRRGDRAADRPAARWAGSRRWPRSTSACAGTPRRAEEALGAMAGQVVSTVLARAECGRPGHRRWTPAGCSPSSATTGPGSCPAAAPVAVDERPPMATVAEYRAALRPRLAG